MNDRIFFSRSGTFLSGEIEVHELLNAVQADIGLLHNELAQSRVKATVHHLLPSGLEARGHAAHLHIHLNNYYTVFCFFSVYIKILTTV